MILGIAGDIGSGKDEVGKIICRLDSRWQIKKFAGVLKQIAGMLLGVSPESFEDRSVKDLVLGEAWNNMSVREFLQRLGTEAIRDGLCEHTWVNCTLRGYTDKDLWVITDVRFPNEVEAIRKLGGKMLKLSKSENNSFNYHKSELSLSHHQFDFYIQNDGTLDELSEKVKSLLNEI